jgi:hypothetical protein
VNKHYVVRIVLPDGVHELDPTMRTFLRLLDHTGVITLHQLTSAVDGVCFDLVPPSGADSDVWTARVANYFAENGFNAVRAPVFHA